MNEYAVKNKNLINDLRKTKGRNTLYVSHYFFALNNYKDLIFYYTPQHYWDKIPVKDVESYVWDNLTQECAVFKNFDPDKNYNLKQFENWIEHKPFFPETPKIGNHYSSLGNRIVSHHGNFYYLGAWGGCVKQSVKNLVEIDVQVLLYYAVMTNTPKYIKSIFDLACFKNTIKIRNTSKTIIGAIAGDIIGSVYEWNNVKTTDFDLFSEKSKFTDDTVLTVAIADCILNEKDFAKTVWEYGRKYRHRGYGGKFKKWLQSDNPKPYGSFGNGAAMRVSAVGFAYDDMETVLEKAKETAEITHNHKEGIKGAQAIASAIFLAQNNKTKEEIRRFITNKFGYNLDFTIDSIRPFYKFDVTCQGSVPPAIKAFLESSNYENAIRLAISIGGDSDTIACMTGGIASAFYKEIPEDILEFAESKLPNEFIEILNEFDIFHPFNL